MSNIRLYGWFAIGFLPCGCVQQTPELGLTESLALIERVKAEPEKAAILCPTLKTDDLQNQCWSTTPIPKTKDKQIERCNHLTLQSKDECFFALSEHHNDIELCSLAGDFSWDCKTHILQQNCGRYSSAKLLLKYTEEIGLDPEHHGVAGLLHRCLLSKPQINIGLCEYVPDPKRCRRLAINLFTQRLPRTINCTTKSSTMKTFNENEFEELVKKEIEQQCSNRSP